VSFVSSFEMSRDKTDLRSFAVSKSRNLLHLNTTITFRSANRLILFTLLVIEEAVILQPSLLFALELATSLEIELSNLAISTTSPNRQYPLLLEVEVSTRTQNTIEISVEVELSNSEKTATMIFDSDETVRMLSIQTS